MSFSPQFLDQLRERLSLAHIIGRRVKLQKRGRDYIGLCPFHKEKTPSFNVVEDKAFYHCLAAETRVLTRQGARPIVELAGRTVEVLTRDGRWVQAPFASYGHQRLWRIDLSRNGVEKTIYATSQHRWFVRERRSEVLTEELRPGHRLQAVLPERRREWRLDPAGVRHGIVFGDGSVLHGRYGHVHLHGEKDVPLAAWFEGMTAVRREYASGKPYLRIYGGRAFSHMKNLPAAGSDEAYLLGFIAGYLAADGHVAKDGTVMLHSADRRHLAWVRDTATGLGIGTFGITSVHRSGFGDEPSEIHRLHFVSSSLTASMFLLDEARARFSAAAKDFERLRWAVVSVAPSDRVEEVYCAEVPVEHAFVLEDNILTGNCFGCGAHGDAIGFTMRTENLGFREAVEALARDAGLDVPEESPASRAATERAATLHEACAAACEAYERQLWSPSGAAGLAYLRGRGLSDDLIRRFRLGWAPEGRAFLRSELGSRFSESLLVEAGLLRHGENGIFDFFRGRVIFPIFDRRGGVIAFGGRTMGDAQPKYLNSPDTPIFHKGRTLYALNLARPSIGPEAPPIVAEGYMDVIALHGAGFATAVAPLGTALTEEHLTELWRLHAAPVICFDGDAAGQRAAVRTLDRALPLLQAEKSLKFLRLPEKHDPDSLIREAGPEAFRSLVERPQLLSDFLWETAARKRKEWSPEQIAELEAGLKRRLQAIPDRTLQYRLVSDVRLRASDLFYAQARARRSAKRGKAASPQLEATLTDSYRDWKLAALLLVGIVNHPGIAHADIDRLVMIGTRDGGLMRLFEAIMQEFSETPDCDSQRLLARITASGCEEQLRAIERSDFYQPTRSLHPDADPYDAALVWRSIFARLRLPELKAELAEVEAEFSQSASPEALDLLERRRQIVADQNSEAELVALQREPDERWQPRAKSAA